MGMKVKIFNLSAAHYREIKKEQGTLKALLTVLKDIDAKDGNVFVGPDLSSASRLMDKFGRVIYGDVHSIRPRCASLDSLRLRNTDGPFTGARLEGKGGNDELALTDLFEKIMNPPTPDAQDKSVIWDPLAPRLCVGEPEDKLIALVSVSESGKRRVSSKTSTIVPDLDFVDPHIRSLHG